MEGLRNVKSIPFYEILDSGKVPIECKRSRDPQTHGQRSQYLDGADCDEF